MAIIIPFPEPAPLSARLTVRDRVAIFRWEAAEQAAGRLGRVALHEEVPCGDREVVDFVLVYAPGKDWAEHGLHRATSGIMTWCCADGAEQGPFATIEDALANLAASMMLARMDEALAAEWKRCARAPALAENAEPIRLPRAADLSPTG